MGRTIIVSRHPALLSFLEQNGHKGEIIKHLTSEQLDSLEVGDRVIGALPMWIARRVTEKGAQYFAVDIGVASGERGTELTVDEMRAAGAKLCRYVVSAVPSGTAPPARLTPHPQRIGFFGGRLRRLLRIILVGGITSVVGGILLVVGESLVSGIKSNVPWLLLTLWAALTSETDVSTLLVSLWHGFLGLLPDFASAVGYIFIAGVLLAAAKTFSGRVLHASFARSSAEARRVVIQGLSPLSSEAKSLLMHKAAYKFSLADLCLRVGPESYSF